MKRKQLVSFFIQDDVEVDDLEDEDSDFSVGEEDSVIPEKRNAKAARVEEPVVPPIPVRRSERNKFKEMSREEMIAYFEERHAENGSDAEQQSTDSEEDYDEDSIEQEDQNEELKPTLNDPNLWTVKVRLGEEKRVTLQLLRKFIARSNAGNPIQINSIVCRDSIKGLIYIESRKKANVQVLVEGVSSIISRQISMVPMNQMIDTLRASKSVPKLKTNDYVRLIRTMYKGDLGQVDWVDIIENQVCLRLLPRINYNKRARRKSKAGQDFTYGSDEEFEKDFVDEEDQQALNDTNDVSDEVKDEDGDVKTTQSKRVIKVRPLPELFDPAKMKEAGFKAYNDGDFIICNGQRYRDGLLYKIFSLAAVTDNDIRPTWEELKYFQDTSKTDYEFIKELARTRINESLNVFMPGDAVEVTLEGEFLNFRGRVVGVEKDGVNVLLGRDNSAKLLKFYHSELRKFFKLGDHVRIIGGSHENATGSIVRVNEDELIILSDLDMAELKVPPFNARLDVHVSSGTDEVQLNTSFKPARRSSRPATTDDIPSSSNDDSSWNKERRQDRTLIGKTVRILQGPMKGYLGIAKDATQATVNVELFSQPRVICVDRTRVAAIDGNTSTQLADEIPQRNPFSP